MKEPFHILIIDDEEAMRDSCRQVLQKQGWSVKTAENGETGLDLLKDESFDLLILDLKMPGIQGMDVLKNVRQQCPETVVVIITGYGTVPTVVEAMKEGAFDFIAKPFTPNELLSTVNRVLEKRKLVNEIAYLRETIKSREDAEVVIGPDKAIYKIYELVWKVAPTDSNVLITGESGTGKELIARAIHRNSSRKEGPFITVDCGSVVPTLFESELFGHVRGAFTDAVNTKQGKLELANGGTLFLDEIGNISVESQSRLLRAIQEREITRVGDTRPIRLDVRLVAATNEDLRNAIAVGRFREDLYYRLNVINIHMPPLRDRKDDIPSLVKYFIAKYGKKCKKPVASLSEKALDLLVEYRWPGNIRELENVIERAVILCEGREIVPEDLPLQDISMIFRPLGSRKRPEPKTLEDMEREYIRYVLQKFGGNKNKSSEYLGIDRKTLRTKIQKNDPASDDTNGS